MIISKALRFEQGDVVTLVGGGGKTTLMFRLADELVGQGLMVVTTMTTKIFVGQMQRAPAGLLLDEETMPFRILQQSLAKHRHVMIGGRIGLEHEKVEGVAPEFIDRIMGERLADIVIVEGDGARRLPLKAPAEHEPVVPRSTTVLVPVVGLDILGRPLDSAHVHRPGLLAALTNARIGDPVTPEIVARVLSHAKGGAKGLPEGARLMPFLNKADDEAALDGGGAIAAEVLASDSIDEVLIGAGEAADPVREVRGRVAAVVLAAGAARRFGTLKQLASWRGIPLVAQVTQQALACPDISQVIVTTGAEGERVREALAGVRETPAAARVDLPERGSVRVPWPINVPDWVEGQSRSVKAGLDAALAACNGKLAAVLYLLADQPRITPELLAALIQRHRETLAPIVAPRHEGQRGNPVLFDRSTFADFAGLMGDVGARSIIRQRENEVAWVDWPSGEIFQDIDTPDDYAGAEQGI